MARLEPLDPARAGGRTKTLFSILRATAGGPNAMELTLAHSPAALEGYLAFLLALGAGTLTESLRQRIALAVSEENESAYGLALHAAAARRAGLSDEDIADGRAGSARDPREDAALEFVHAVLALRGHVSDQDLARVRAAGFGEGEIAEMVANLALVFFTNYLTNVARPRLDLPRVEPAAGGVSASRRVELIL